MQRYRLPLQCLPEVSAMDKRSTRSGNEVNVWTVNTEVLMKEMIEAGVDYITTDEPVLLQNFFKITNNKFQDRTKNKKPQSIKNLLIAVLSCAQNKTRTCTP
ncbi:MAG: glycerophosphodiester phosphodiesterase family protein [Mangrovibacterium sp.]